ncbi:MAG: hypothetical protein HYY93_09190 [Planctomycetes bacterium]|nr:hypothetical protein [Planctomycetota bacterium]
MASSPREEVSRAVGPPAVALRWTCLVALAQHLSTIIVVIYITLIRHIRGRASRPTDPTTILALLGSLLLVLWLSHAASRLKLGRDLARCSLAARVAVLLGIAQTIAALGILPVLDVVVLQYAMFPGCILFLTVGGWISWTVGRSEVAGGFEG